jgi:predicted enzyme related to lactoylglutathione lyase
MAEQTQTQGTFVWNEIMSRDFPKAKAFYTELLGWTTREMDMGPAGKYTIFTSAGKDVAGGMGTGAGMDQVPSHWLSYVSVPNVDDSVKKAQSMSGTILVPPTDIPGVGRFAIVQDPTGAALGLLTSK